MAKRGETTPEQWAEIEVQWISTNDSPARIGAPYGLSEGAIRKRAKKAGWGPRNSAERKRAYVASRLAGVPTGTSLVPRTKVEEAIHGAADQDVEDMTLAVSVARSALHRCRFLFEMRQTKDGVELDLPALLDPRDVKAATEAAKAAAEMIRKIRGLDAPGGDGDLTIEFGDVVGRRQ